MPKKRDFPYHFDGNQPSPPKKYGGTYCVFDAGTTWCNGHSQSDGHTASSLHSDSLPVPCRSALQLLKFISFNVIQYGFIFTMLSENQEWDILSKPRKYHLSYLNQHWVLALKWLLLVIYFISFLDLLTNLFCFNAKIILVVNIVLQYKVLLNWIKQRIEWINERNPILLTVQVLLYTKKVKTR